MRTAYPMSRRAKTSQIRLQHSGAARFTTRRRRY